MHKFLIILSIFFSTLLSQTDKISNLVLKEEFKQKFTQKFDDNWNFRWNEHGTPHRIFGNNIPYVFDSKSDDLSEYYARKFINENQFIFGIENSNLELWVNEYGSNMRYLTFNQTYEGIPIHNARIDFRFNNVGNLVLFGHDGYPNINVDTQFRVKEQQALNIGKETTNFNIDKGDYVFDDSAYS